MEPYRLLSTSRTAMSRRRFPDTIGRPTAVAGVAALALCCSGVFANPPVFTGGILTASPASLTLWPGFSTSVLAFNGSVPGPTIRVTRGSYFEAQVVNQLAEPLVVHWHGLLAPARMDGHPVDAVPAGGSYRVSFPVTQRAGTYWYHAHTDGLTGKQAYRGLAGAFIIEDPAEAALGLPSGDHDRVLVLADKRPDAAKQLPYAPAMLEVMNGFLGTEILANESPSAAETVDQGLYRLRLINASNARILKIGFSDNRTYHLIANDAGLLAAPAPVTSFFMPPGARAELLVNFSGDPVGTQVTMRTLTFPGSGMGPPGTPRQGTPMDIVRFTVNRAGFGGSIPAALAAFTPWSAAQARRTRRFTLSSVMGGGHFINGQAYSLTRTDFTVPRGELEIWEYVNTTTDPHPLHLHGAHFQVVSRNGSTALAPEDTGWKDVVLVNDSETVRVLVKFEAYGGVFLQHCHNLEHEDDGMMQNFEVQSSPADTLAGAGLCCERAGTQIEISWIPVRPDLIPEASANPGSSANWNPVAGTPVLAAGRYRLTAPIALPGQFFRLRHP